MIRFNDLHPRRAMVAGVLGVGLISGGAGCATDAHWSPAPECTPGTEEPCPNGVATNGPCDPGTRVCAGDGYWGACRNTVEPMSVDLCGNGVNDDCDCRAGTGDGTAYACVEEVDEGEACQGALDEGGPGLWVVRNQKTGQISLIAPRGRQRQLFQNPALRTRPLDDQVMSFLRGYAHDLGLPSEIEALEAMLRPVEDTTPRRRVWRQYYEDIPVVGGGVVAHIDYEIVRSAPARNQDEAPGAMTPADADAPPAQRREWFVQSMASSVIPIAPGSLPTGDALEELLLPPDRSAAGVRGWVAARLDAGRRTEGYADEAGLPVDALSGPWVLPVIRRTGEAIGTESEHEPLISDAGVSDAGAREATSHRATGYCIEPRLVYRVESGEAIWFIDALIEPTVTGACPTAVTTAGQLIVERVGRIDRALTATVFEETDSRPLLCSDDAGCEGTCMSAEPPGLCDLASVVDAGVGDFDALARFDLGFLPEQLAPLEIELEEPGRVYRGMRWIPGTAGAPNRIAIEGGATFGAAEEAIARDVIHELLHGWMDHLHPEKGGLGSSVQSRVIEEGLVRVLSVLARCAHGGTCGRWPALRTLLAPCPSLDARGQTPEIECDSPPPWADCDEGGCDLQCHFDCESDTDRISDRLSDALVYVGQDLYEKTAEGRSPSEQADRWIRFWREVTERASPDQMTLAGFGPHAVQTCIDRMTAQPDWGDDIQPADCTTLIESLHEAELTSPASLGELPQRFPELCNAKDDDFDGEYDEEPHLVGEDCILLDDAAAWRIVMSRAEWAAHCPPLTALARADDVLVFREPPEPACRALLQEPCELGKTVCTEHGTLVCENTTAPTSRVEVCDGKDDDCDGIIDEGDGLFGGHAIDRGARTGQYCDDSTLHGICREGELTCGGDAGLVCVSRVRPRSETCDGVDEDCDGRKDSEERSLSDDPEGGIEGLERPCLANEALDEEWRVVWQAAQRPGSTWRALGCDRFTAASRDELMILDGEGDVEACRALLEEGVCTLGHISGCTDRGTFACAPDRGVPPFTVPAGGEYEEHVHPIGVLRLDLPDDDGVDVDCDGMDGSRAYGMFVRPALDGAVEYDVEPSFANRRLGRLQDALDAAYDEGRWHVYLRGDAAAEGETIYPLDETLSVLHGTSLFGGYDAAFVRREGVAVLEFTAAVSVGVSLERREVGDPTGRTHIVGLDVRVEGDAPAEAANAAAADRVGARLIDAEKVTMRDVTVSTGAGGAHVPPDGRPHIGSAMGVLVRGGEGVVLEGVTASVGPGGAGVNGRRGEVGEPACDGTAGQAAQRGSDAWARGGLGGAGPDALSRGGDGASTPAASANWHGRHAASHAERLEPGDACGADPLEGEDARVCVRTNGLCAGSGQGGAGGASRGRMEHCEFGGRSTRRHPPDSGSAGCNGASGGDGADGEDGTPSLHVLADGRLTTPDGADGARGDNGLGGGGGGAGGGWRKGCSGGVCDCDSPALTGGAGGGGGGGGQGGAGGRGGAGGGASVGVVMVGCLACRIKDLVARTAAGGTGGEGGEGGDGGDGGDGGAGGAAKNNNSHGRPAPGGGGGSGGDGGRGGHGGDGAVGASICLVTDGSLSLANRPHCVTTPSNGGCSTEILDLNSPDCGG